MTPDLTDLALLAGRSDDVALVEANGSAITYDELIERIGHRRDELADLVGHLVFLGASLSVATVVDYLALTSQGTCVALLDPATSAEVMDGWSASYQPSAAWGFDNAAPSSLATEPRVRSTERVLLTTSGSTGSPKFVRLSTQNITSNAAQIASALSLTSDERALAHLPLFYSFGLSILNSHLAAGASVALSNASAIEPAFVEQIRENSATSVSGVPFNFDIFRRVGLFDNRLPSLRNVTQAGGRLRPDMALQLHEKLDTQGIALWIMYGQTEATARIAILPPDELLEAAESVGYALPDAKLQIEDPNLDGSGEVIYEGPNVMLGYATSCDELDGSDELSGVLRTGDIGRFDDAGRLVITGRAKRIAKVAGLRISLDDVERQLDAFGPLAAIDAGSRIRVVMETTEESVSKRDLERLLKLGPGSVELLTVDALPCTANGKPDYAAIRELT